MPEGHSIHRYASEHRKALRGQLITTSSPQGRFNGGAARINGRKLLDVEAHGKHLFYRWHRAETLHIHLGLYGRFRSFRSDPPPPTPNTRLTLSTEDATIYLSGPTVCELIDPSREEMIRSRLGPDPLKAGTDGNSAAVFAANLARRRIPIGAAVLDQSVIAGIGNIYRSETLFLTGIDPATPANEVPPETVDQLWATSVKLLERGLREGKIVTVDRRALDSRHLEQHDELHVYRRERFPCRACGGAISHGEMANRRIWWCASCQA